MSSSLKHGIDGTVHVDEFMIGGPEEGKRRRSKADKKLIVLAVEILENGVGRACICKGTGCFFKKICLKRSNDNRR